MRNTFMNKNNAMTAQSFYGYCYTCNKFDHRAADCRYNMRSEMLCNMVSHAITEIN